jgi:hypothetical protein
VLAPYSGHRPCFVTVMDKSLTKTGSNAYHRYKINNLPSFTFLLSMEVTDPIFAPHRQPLQRNNRHAPNLRDAVHPPGRSGDKKFATTRSDAHHRPRLVCSPPMGERVRRHAWRGVWDGCRAGRCGCRWMDGLRIVSVLDLRAGWSRILQNNIMMDHDEPYGPTY